jgi:hypothetical protein
MKGKTGAVAEASRRRPFVNELPRLGKQLRVVRLGGVTYAWRGEDQPSYAAILRIGLIAATLAQPALWPTRMTRLYLSCSA